MRRLLIFLLGVKEFRSSMTTHFGWPEIETYDRGREFAHAVTFRRFEP